MFLDKVKYQDIIISTDSNSKINSELLYDTIKYWLYEYYKIDITIKSDNKNILIISYAIKKIIQYVNNTPNVEKTYDFCAEQIVEINDALRVLKASRLVELSLIYEYGFVLERLKNKEWDVITLDIDEVNCYYKPVIKTGYIYPHYLNISGIVEKSKLNKYYLIDGRHRHGVNLLFSNGSEKNNYLIYK